jgi:crotonobetainyl-CoA:carnitine CoA-transferase CaiB-like acyl-CoA transferase
MGGAGYQAVAALQMRCPTIAEIREASRQIMRANDPNPDPNTAVIVASATLLALLHRERTGDGQRVYVDMLTANAHANADAFLAYEGMAPRPALDPELLGTGPLDRLYETADGWVLLTITTDAEWDRFRGLTGPSLAGLDRGAPRLDEALTVILRGRTAEDWEQRAAAAGVAMVRADRMSPGNVTSRDPHLVANGLAPEVEHARFGVVRRWGPLVTVGDSGRLVRPGVLAGQQTDAVLAELGFSEDRITELRAARVVASEPVNPWPAPGS